MAMKLPPRLRLEPRPSRIACATLVALGAAVAVLLAALPLPAMSMALGGCVVGVVVGLGLRRCIGRGVPALLHVGIDRRISVVDRRGRSHAGLILDDSYVGTVVTTVVWRADCDPWWRPARAVLVLPDTLPPDDFRRLRVALRYGRADGGVDSSGTDAA
jgi:hypothetical protein